MAQSFTAAAAHSKLRLMILISTGMVMFVFLTMHLANLALGLISLQTMEDWRGALSGVWSSFWPLRYLLEISFVLHFIVALWSLYLRNTLRVPAYDMAQMIAGVLIIPLMAMHVFGVMATEELGLEPTYALVLGQFWITSPFDGLQQIVLVVCAWIHGAIGVYTWVRAREGSSRILSLFYPFVVALPILAMLGYVEAGRQIIPLEEGGGGIVLMNDPNADFEFPGPERMAEVIAMLETQKAYATQGVLALVGIVLIARWLRLSRQSRSAVQVSYTGRRPASFEAETGLTLLEMAREHDVPHASKCRGRGRCGTCRVRVLAGAETLSAPGQLESEVLARWNAGPDERLACQVKPAHGALEVERVIEADYSNLDYGDMRRPKPVAEGTA